MAIQSLNLYCHRCQAETGHTKTTTTHTFHLLMTIFTLGAWWVVWLVLWIFGFSAAKCSHCGSSYNQRLAVAAKARLQSAGYAALPAPVGVIRRCPFCAEEVRVEAIKCRHCGSALEAPAQAQLDSSHVVVARQPHARSTVQSLVESQNQSHTRALMNADADSGDLNVSDADILSVSDADILSDAANETRGRPQLPAHLMISEPVWATQPNRSRLAIGEHYLAKHGFATDPRGSSNKAPKPRPSVFLWIIFGILGGSVAIYGAYHLSDKSTHSKPADSPPVALEPCADLGGFHICVDLVVQRHSMSDIISTTTAGENQAFVMVHVTLSSTKTATAGLAWPMFELRDGTRHAWDPDIDSQITASMAGYRTLDFEQLHPGTAIGGWLVYYVPTSAIPDLHLRFQPGLVRSVDLGLPAVGDAICTLGRKSGVCIDVAKCTGTHSAGLCDGPANVQCCVQ